LEAAVGGAEVAGKNLKSNKNWYKGGTGTDKYGFSALPGGYNGGGGNFYYAGGDGFWWTADGNRSISHAYDYCKPTDFGGMISNKYGFSVRCVQDNADGSTSSGENNCGKDGTAGSCKTVVIGNQTWMSENLNREVGNSWCFGGKSSNCNKYGRLYDWNTAKKACPAGYHLPSNDEWEELVRAVGGSSVAGRKLKVERIWYKNGIGTNEYGFSALPGGRRYSDGSYVPGGLVGDEGYWWTSSVRVIPAGKSEGYAEYRSIYYNSDGVKADFSATTDGYSIRCVQDK